MKRRLAAILAADVVGFAGLMERDETGTLEALHAHREGLFNPVTAEHGGRIVKLMGDGTLVEFPSVVDAVEAALAIQRAMAEDTSNIVLRIGINLGDVIIEGEDIYGDGVNVAARLEALAEPGGICISSVVHESLGTRVGVSFSDAGDFKVKSVSRPIRVFRWPARHSATNSRSSLVPEELLRGQTISVSRFEHLSNDEELKYFCEGITQDIITAFGNIEQLTVLEGEHRDNRNAQINGAHYLLSGNSRKAGNRIRTSAKLVDQRTGVQVWADRFDRDATDLFDVQDNVTRNIVIAVHTNLGAGSYTNRWQWGTEDFEAWQLMAKGFHEFQKFSPESFAKAVTAFEQALAIDPDYMAPLLASAYCYGQLAWIDEDDAALTLIAKAEVAVERAVEAAPEDVRRFAAIRAIEIARGNFDAAVDAAQTALDMAPTDSYTRATMAFALMNAGRAEEALAQAAKAERDMPSTPGWFDTAKVQSHYMLGNLAEAIQTARDAIARSPDLYPVRALLVALAGELDQSDEVETTRTYVLQMEPQFSAKRFVRWCGLRDEKHRERVLNALVDAGLPG